MLGLTKQSGLWQIVRLTGGVLTALLLAPIGALVLAGLAILLPVVALIGFPTRTIQSPLTVLRWSLIAAATAALAPAAIIMLTFAAFFLAPVALICIPFMLPVFFELATHEREHEIEHRMLPQIPAHAH